MKYVILLQKLPGLETERAHVLIFPEYQTHSVVATGYTFSHLRMEGSELTLQSAGFCWLNDAGMWEAHAGSESLKIPKGDGSQDAAVLNMPNAMQGLVNVS